MVDDTDRCRYLRSMHTENPKGCARVRQRIGERRESAIKSIGPELVELVLALLVLLVLLGFAGLHLAEPRKLCLPRR